MLEPIERAFAEKLLEGHPDTPEEVSLFLGYLLAAVRNGHICVKVDGNRLFPSPADLWERESLPPNVSEMLEKGASALPAPLVTDAPGPFPLTPICRENNLYYLQRYWLYEKQFAEHLDEMIHTEPAIEISPDLITGDLLPDQEEAIRNACRHRFAIISGGPGTGKSYTAGHLIKAILESLSPSVRSHFSIALAAPTGKAAANLQSSLHRAMNGETTLHSHTLHSLLKVGGRRPFGMGKLAADLVLVDESSMIDVKLMTKLFSAIKPGARLVLLGDPYQLPPVEAGSLFADVIDWLQGEQVVELTQCLRTEMREIVQFAEQVKQGECQAALQELKRGHSGLTHLTFADQRDLLSHAAPNFPFHFCEDPQQLLQSFQQYRLLSPLRKGAEGVEAINRLFFTYFSRKVGWGEWLVTPILLTKNDYRLKLFNGDVGVLVRRWKGESAGLQEGDYLLLPDRDDPTSVRKLPALLMPSFEYAYCLSVHKSQGSEFDRVLLLMPEGTERFGREILYTAATRAKKRLEVTGSDATLIAAIQRSSRRQSGILHRQSTVPHF